MVLKFECLKCGRCCRNLVIDVIIGGKTFLLGMFLWKEEVRHFAPDKVLPLYGAGIKGRSRVRPAEVFAYQYIENVCPHITKNNLCRIYNYRPLICRSFPLENSQLKAQCGWVKKQKELVETHEPLIVGQEIVNAERLMSIKTINALDKYNGALWIYPLDTRKWVRVNVSQILR